MDEATQGVVYLSFGSNVKSSTLLPKFLSLISKVLSDLPYLVLWKWEVDSTSPHLGKSVVTRRWFPQQDILAHPNIKVFVTQGGLQSIEEAISRNVPMVGVPFIADQPTNVERISELKIAEMIDWTTVTEDQLRDAILKVAEEPEYRERIKKIRDILLDQPMTGLEKAVWWTEYVIRHKGAKHLRSILADTSLWEYLLLDVVAVVLASVTVTLYVLYKLISICRRKLKFSKKVKVKVT
ncbi:unnamed protein product [Ceutorhynchus assimilis]|uniref:UDP-glucuronosyltransferase n=1 Tax=Ceutorhynchus assimilis TaxID=467358 RepID=A0A9N9QKR3_9CUCU|nr:unnamed protein product [Ceutorhynchus assimilis]